MTDNNYTSSYARIFFSLASDSTGEKHIFLDTISFFKRCEYKLICSPPGIDQHYRKKMGYTEKKFQ